MRLSVIIPAYNEAFRLEPALKEYLGYLSRVDYSWEIIIVNDGSTDQTADLVKKITINWPQIKLVNLASNRGKGAALRQGFKEAKGDFQLFVDADNSASLSHLDLAWPLFEQGYDLIIGSRHGRDAKSAAQVVSQPFWKRVLNSAGNLFIQALAVPGIWDTQCGFKVFTKKTADDLWPLTKIDRWAIDIEILTLAKKRGRRLGIIPVSWENAGDSKVNFAAYLKTLVDLIKLKIVN